MLKLTRPEPVFIERPDRKVYRIDPPTRAQVRAVLALDPPTDDTSETALDTDARVAKQLRELVGASGIEVDADTGEPITGAPRLPLDSLAREEEEQIIFALIARHLGRDPAQAVATAQVLGSFTAGLMLVQAVPNESSNSTPTASLSPSTSEPTSPPPSA